MSRYHSAQHYESVYYDSPVKQALAEYTYHTPPSSETYSPVKQALAEYAYHTPPSSETYPSFSTRYESKPSMNKYTYQASNGPSMIQQGTTTYPPKSGSGGAPFRTPFSGLLPSTFPPGTDPKVMSCFQMADQDRSGFIDDKELQKALSSYNQTFSLRTVHLMMFHFTNNNTRKIGPKEFTTVFYHLQNWREIFEQFDFDRNGQIDSTELQRALTSLGFSVSPVILDLLLSKYDKTAGSIKQKGLQYDHFIECCLTIKVAVRISIRKEINSFIFQGLSEKFRERDNMGSGSANFSYDDFMLSVLPFIIA